LDSIKEVSKKEYWKSENKNPNVTDFRLFLFFERGPNFVRFNYESTEK
jgi:hypothetical protein